MVRRSKSELTAPKQVADAGDEAKQVLKELLPEEYSGEDALSGVYKIICDYSVKQLQPLYFAFQKEYGQEQGTELYRLLKPQIRTIYKKIPK